MLTINQTRLWSSKKAIIQKLLPLEPIDFEIAHWWEVYLAPISEEDRRVFGFISSLFPSNH